jgi:IS30 family transposase
LHIKYHRLTQEERYAITAQLMCGRSPAQIAQWLGRDRSTISRELRRNATSHDGVYRAGKAHSDAAAHRRHCRRRPHFTVDDMALVARLLRKKRSAEQISGVLRWHDVAHQPRNYLPHGRAAARVLRNTE